jgi:hypothetical protein
VSERHPPASNPLRKVNARGLTLRVAFQTLGHLAPGRAASFAISGFRHPCAHACR